MTSYNIDLTDPLKNGFVIQPGGFDGPGGSQASTSLRLYGRGALEWGEAVDEDLVRLAETFAGSTPPRNAIGGQLWYETRFYVLNTFNSSWHVFDPNAKTWGFLNGSLAASQIGISVTPPSGPTIGQYWFDGTTLYRWDSAYKQEVATWLPRAYNSANLLTANAQPTLPPTQALKAFDAYANSGAGAWVVPSSAASSSTAPANPQIGTLWYDTSVGILKVYDGSSPNPWKQLLGSAASGSAQSFSDINMANTYKVINLPTPSAAGDATSKQYVDNLLSTSLTGYLPSTGGTLSGPGNLVVNGSFTANGSFNSTTVSTATFAGGVQVGNAINVTNHQINNLATGVSGSDAVNVTQMNTSINNAITSLGGVTASTVPILYPGTGTYKAGDISITGGKIYMAIGSGTGAPPGGNWKQIWPSTYA